MKKCKCPYAHFNYMGHEEIEIVDCLVYNREIGEHYECYCNNNEKSELFYENCCLYKLQSKIDKAIEYIDYHDVIYNNGYINEKHKFDKSINPKELLDILKEVENVENN